MSDCWGIDKNVNLVDLIGKVAKQIYDDRNRYGDEPIFISKVELEYIKKYIPDLYKTFRIIEKK